MNKVTILGRLGRAPERRTTQTGKTVVSFSVASDEGYGDRKSTEWFNCVAWDQSGEAIAKHFGQGKPIYLEGRFSSRKYTDKAGVERTATEVTVTSWAFVPGEPKGQGQQGGYQGAPQQQGGYGPAPSHGGYQGSSYQGAPPPADDDIPF